MTVIDRLYQDMLALDIPLSDIGPLIYEVLENYDLTGVERVELAPIPIKVDLETERVTIDMRYVRTKMQQHGFTNTEIKEGASIVSQKIIDRFMAKGTMNAAFSLDEIERWVDEAINEMLNE